MLYSIKVDLEQSNLSEDELDELALGQFNSAGKMDFSIDEARVDELLGKKAFCGGDLPEDVMNDLESKIANSQSSQYFWSDELQMKQFCEYLDSHKVSYSLDQIEQEDWNKSWRENFKQIIVADDLSVVPSWEKLEDTSSKLYIYPGMGFGTGNHETTFLCLKIYNELIKENTFKHVLDFGCGSGILGIAAIKKQKSSVCFMDIDSDALDNCLANLNENDYENYSTDHSLIIRDRFKPEKYDLVFANILENVLLMEKEVILNSLKSGAFLIISGLLAGSEQVIVDNYNELECVQVLKKGDWAALLLKKN